MHPAIAPMKSLRLFACPGTRHRWEAGGYIVSLHELPTKRVKIIGRYVLKEHVGPFVFASTALTSLMLLQYIAKRFGDLVGKGLPASVIAEFMALSVPFTVAMTLPMAVLVAVLYAFSRLAAENEINAMKASGVGMRTVLTPVLLGGLAMSAVMVAFNDQVLPRSNHRLAILQLDIFRTKPTFALREQVINTIKEGQLYLKAGDINQASEMKDVVIYDLSDPQRRRTIYAESGKLALAPNGKDLDMTLHNGMMLEVPNKEPSELTRLFYTWDRLRVENVLSSYQETQSGSISKGDREMSVCEMNAELSRADFLVRTARHDIALAEFERAGARGPRPQPPQTGVVPNGIGSAYCALLRFLQPGEAQAAQAPGAARTSEGARAAAIRLDSIRRADSSRVRDSLYRAGSTSAATAAGTPAHLLPDTSSTNARIQEAQYRMAEARRERNRYDVEIQKKFSLAAACIIFVLIGAPVALRFPRGGVGLVIGVSFAIFGLYYVGLIGGETLADKGFLPPWLAMWSANILLALTGLLLASRMGRESSTSRGGDFGELIATTRARVFGWMRRVGIPVERRK
jgi:lipopolysaccharide export system permease protein